VATPVASGAHVIAVPELRGHSFEVIRHNGDSDDAYALRCALFRVRHQPHDFMCAVCAV
jgi:hypothetical protein